MGTDSNYPVSAWGEHVKFVISPSGYDHIIVDSDVMPATEYKFDWLATDGTALLKKGMYLWPPQYVILMLPKQA